MDTALPTADNISDTKLKLPQRSKLGLCFLVAAVILILLFIAALTYISRA